MKEPIQPRETITDENMARHNRYSQDDGARDAHAIYLSNFAGDLATLSREDARSAGYPMGSVAPFMLDHTGNPVIHTAGVAEHTKNVNADPRAALTLREVEKNHHIETGWRLCCMGDLLPVNDEDEARIRAAYFRHYPHAELYEGTHNFCFYRLNVKIARVIMGFGRITWVEPESLVHASPFDAETEERIIQHMNDDHVAAMEKYLAQNRVELLPNAKAPKMVGISQFGVTLRYRKRLHFVRFDTEVHDAKSAREQLVSMAQV